MRIGIGYDVHKLVAGRALILGGVTIPFDKGLEGYSDADVLVHAICDALFGAAGLKDIGTQFPDTDARYKDISSLLLLKEANNTIMDKGFIIHNIDASIVAQQPILTPYIDDMRTNLSSTLGTGRDQVTVKATTTEGLGFPGREEGIAAYAVALIE
jgi:2-C-methyl-D-erythritol 2,4-cyclodiphosphate synthase